MRVGIDLRPLQSPMTTGETLGILRIAGRALADHLPDGTDLVVLLDPAGPDVALEVAQLFGDRSHRIVGFPEPRFRRLAKLIDPVSEERERILESEIDVLVQPDPSLGVPKRTPTVLLVADLVPILLGDRHPHRHRPTFRGARRAGVAAPEAAYRSATRKLHEHHLRIGIARASMVFTPLRHTAELLSQHLHDRRGADHRIRTIAMRSPLPEAELNALESNRVAGLGLDRSRFLLFTGSSHAGARIDHLIAAFNDRRAHGDEIALVLAGEDLDTVDSMVDRSAAAAIRESSYRDDIHLLGAVRPEMRRWLLDQAALIVLPGELVGFGSGLADAAEVGRSVIAYSHPAVRPQVGPDSVLVAPRWEELSHAIEAALGDPPPARPARATDEAPKRFGEELIRALTTIARRS